MSNLRVPGKHFEDHSDPRGRSPNGITPVSKHRSQTAAKPKKQKPRKSTNRGDKKPSNAGPRYRARDVGGFTAPLGVLQLVNNAGASVSDTPYSHSEYPLIERMWDESHKLTRPVLGWYKKYYKIPGTGRRGARPLIGVRNQRIFGKPVHNDGGPLRYIKCELNPGESQVQGVGQYFGRDFRPYGFAERYTGGFVPANWSHGYSEVDFNLAGFSAPFGPDYEDALPYGAEAYRKMKPTISDFDAMQGFGQNMIELPSQLRTTAQGFHKAFQALKGSRSAAKELFMPRHIAEQFLNEQFGWVPFVSDLLDLHKAYSQQSKRFAEISSQNNKWNRRKRTLFNIEEQSPITVIDDFAGNCYPALTSGFYRSSGTYVTSRLYTLTKRKVWGVGAFKFYAPEFDNMNRASEGTYGEIMRLVHYYGVRISPTVVWELTPWTWLADWFTNAGTLVENLTAQVFDRLVSRYAYVMCQSQKWAFNETVIHLKDGDVNCVWKQKISSKRRAEASPYGFGLTGGDLTTRQKAILAAIGMTRR